MQPLMALGRGTLKLKKKKKTKNKFYLLGYWGYHENFLAHKLYMLKLNFEKCD